VHLASLHGQFFTAVDVARLPDGRILVAYIYRYPAVLEGILCSNYACAHPKKIDIDSGFTGDHVRVAANAATVAVAFGLGGIVSQLSDCRFVLLLVHFIPDPLT
jgi:hypothetical protein